MSRRNVLLLMLGVLICITGFTILPVGTNSIPVQTFKTTTEDGFKISYDVIRNLELSENTPIAILFHGFAGNREMMKPIATSLAENGFISVLVDFRGHGDSNGFILFDREYDRDVNAIIRALREKDIGNTSKIILIGHSMGGRVAIQFASKSEFVIATIGVAPYITPEMVSNTSPKNLQFIIAKYEFIISNNDVISAFYKSINGTGQPNTIYNLDGNKRMLYIAENANHLTVIYKDDVIYEITKWATKIALEKELSFLINPNFVNIPVYTSVIGGTMITISTSVMIYDKLKEWKRLISHNELKTVQNQKKPRREERMG